MHTISDKKLLMLRPEELISSKNQPRKSFDVYELKLLADSIAASGIIQPLAVRKNQDGKYEIIAGERRLKAAVMAGIRRVPCVLHKTDDVTAALYAMIENLQRSNLDFFEEALGIEKLITVYGMSQLEVAARLGMAQSTVSNKLRLLRLDQDLRSQIISANLTERHARALLKLNPEKRILALNRIIADGLSLKQSEALIEEIISPKSEEIQKEKMEKPIRKSAIGDVRLFSNSLSKLLDTLQNAGIDARSQKYENDKYIEYKVRIKKELPENMRAEQLRIC